MSKEYACRAGDSGDKGSIPGLQDRLINQCFPKCLPWRKGFPGFQKFGKHHALYPLLEINSIYNTQY